jgi:hypothetical protein
MHKKVTFITFDILSQIAPLAGAYLQAYACLDPEIRETWQFEQYVNLPARVTPEQLTAEMIKADADVYAFSCYAWNMGLFKAAVPLLLEAKPQAHLILGGPQVMNCGQKYLSPEHENLVLCNGEGEKSFKNYLKELSTDEPNFSRVKGLSFYLDGKLNTTQPEERIKDLDEIPSPILNGLFDPSISTHIFMETNRGCPFTCHYCYWGGAIGAKVNKFSDERIRAELEWVAKNNIYSVVIVDANWGILQRDVELSRYISECKEKYGSPQMVGFSGSKNTPERVSEITKIFYDAGLLLNHTISLQTMQETTLKMVGRQNIKTEAYMSMQNYLNENGISSHIELIWPLPGETLSTFIDGIDQLCAKDADMFFCHPLYLINNIELNNRREAYGIVTEESTVVGSEAEVVVQTNDVSYADYLEGWRFMFATIILHNLRSLYCLSNYLDKAGIESHGAIFSKFLEFLTANPETPLAKIVEEAILVKSVEPYTLGRIAYFTHNSRAEFDQLLFQFVSSQTWWEDKAARLFFEVDLLNRPHFYAFDGRETRFPFKQINILEVTPEGYVIEVPSAHTTALKSFLGAKASFQSNSITINHQQKQPAYAPAPYVEMYWMHCYHAAFTVVQMSPTWHDSGVTAKAA